MLWLTSIALLAVAAGGSPLTQGVRKCCPLGELLIGVDKCRPLNASLDGDDVASDAWWWVDDDIKPHLQVATANVGFGVRPVCDRSTRTLLSHNLDEYRLVLGDGPSVLLESLVDSSLTVGDDEAWHSFPTDMFCLDGIPLGTSAGVQHVAVLCPCAGDLACVRKCCGYGRAFNVTALKCNPVQNHVDWVPEFDAAAKGKEEHRYFHLTSQPSCAADEATAMMLGRNREQLGRLGLVYLRDGGLKINATQETFAKDKFCGDFTTDGDEVLVHCVPKMTTKETMPSTSFAVLFAIAAVTVALLLVVLVSLL